MTSSKYIEYLQTEVEGQLLDRKRASINPKDVAQHISAFANAEGGKLVIGIEDNGEISGFNHSKAKKKEVYIEAPFEHLYRIPKYTHEVIEVKKLDGTMDEILIFDIEPSYDAIITLKDDSVYLRVNDKSRKLTYNQITNLEYDRGSRRYEEELVEYSSIEDVDEELVGEFKQLLNTNVDNEKLLKARGFMREGKLTVAGLLLFSNNINVYLPGARIRFMRYEGTKEEYGTRLNVVKDITFDKALPVAIREARAFINTQLREYTFLGKEGRFVTLPEYPEFAWFEGMINAIVHRRYDNQGDHIRIKMFDDRLEISSPGALPASVTLENIKEERYSRNPKLAAALTQYKWVRESNEGVGRIFDEMKDYFLDDPVYSEPNNSSVQLTLKNNIVARKERETGRVSNIITPELFESLNEQQELIVRHLYNQGELTASKIANIIQRSVPTARKRLKELEEMNIISTHGSSKNDPKRTYYLLGFE
ncbi:ATP-dependent DNA helicase RecG [Staphylococcus felis]|uniref:ATP-binding protein n=1 Tax=Staphylococcus felis TaxID=46127 RepID=UPI000E21FF4F|nr:ATP-binding protein [Staphylococcus felis]REH77585.1 ATP-dependent DNA helicase RecG [Staphylococcus felis]REH92390.1 ATP-dependent DNA helicase RecG [Staphylococcus felis]REH94404.1 ATP-dependent DNA helicase RecG [Staphylococcus felis]REH96351.1 ATP-dependent DNA helicase RecG [Staphylococcus felis]REI02354.1 ATP-dependent DNA helicase RecG [Staphylococcus felis]